MQRLPIYQAPFFAFFSRNLYRQVVTHWKGTGLAYLFILLATCWIFPSVKAQLWTTEFIEEEVPKIVKQVPSFEINNGFASIQETQPYFIVNYETGEPIIIIDTTNTITSLEGTPAKVLITKKEVIRRKNNLETHHHSFHEIKNFKLNQLKINLWLDWIKELSGLIIFIIGTVGEFVVRVFQVLLFAVISLYFSSRFSSFLSFKTLLRISAIAVTPCIVGKTILDALGANIECIDRWDLVVGFIYLYIILKSISSQDNLSSQTDELKIAS